MKQNLKTFEMGTYGYDLNYLASKGIEALELKSEDGKSKVMIVPALQGRVMTSTTDGDDGPSYGWINYRFIDEGKICAQFNPYGGEERFWIGPEGGPYSWYFKEGEEQVYANWNVPSAIDTDAFDVLEKSDSRVVFARKMVVKNASNIEFNIDVQRTVSLLNSAAVSSLLGFSLPSTLKTLAYKTDNVLLNAGDFAWNKETGMPSVWLLGTLNPTPTTTVFIPYNQDFNGKLINDEYFGKVPSDRLILDNGMAYFKIDGEYRAKIGLPSGSAKDLCGSYDSEKKVLNILKYTVPEGHQDYVNGQWGKQDDPFSGDVINSYNDGPTETGNVMGPFYEIETSSPAAALAPGQSLSHVQYTIHIQGEESDLEPIVKSLFGVTLSDISTRFKK